ncbi:MAG: RrF2 family transcriptional regulator [Pseudobutyrivibrio sp.]|nr:RrF2 family transcriptional regulator [Pseudobutyrivibrio sp.]
MIISTRGRYALRVMIDIVQHNDSEYIPLKEIAERQEISEKYLESILKILVSNKLVEGVRGKNGGYRLSRDAEKITAWDVISVTENELTVVSCLNPDSPACDRAANCSTLPMWREFNKNLKNFFSNYTIEDLATGKQ